MKTYLINEIFYSIQGEGVRAGTANVFVRFAGCNLKCDIEPGPKSPGGFACDTEFESGRRMTAKEIVDEIFRLIGNSVPLGESNPSAILTGGEPGLQIDKEFVDRLHKFGIWISIETNGTIELPPGIDWVTLSPKVAEHALKVLDCDELKYVRGYGQGIPNPRAKASHLLISPAFDGMSPNHETLQWCVKLVKENPEWRLSLQTHKWLGVR